MSFDRCDHGRSNEESKNIGNLETEQGNKIKNKRKECLSKPSTKKSVSVNKRTITIWSTGNTYNYNSDAD